MRSFSNAEMRDRRIAAQSFLDAYQEGRPIDELRTQLPLELEAIDQSAAADAVRSFFPANSGQSKPAILGAVRASVQALRTEET